MLSKSMTVYGQNRYHFNQDLFFSFFLFNKYSFSLPWNLFLPHPSAYCFLLLNSLLLEMFGLTSKEKNMSTAEHLCPHGMLWWQWYTPFTSVALSWTLMLPAFKDLTPQGKGIQVKNVDLCLTHSLLQEHLALICSRVKKQTYKMFRSSEPCSLNHIQNKHWDSQSLEANLLLIHGTLWAVWSNSTLNAVSPFLFKSKEHNWGLNICY